MSEVPMSEEATASAERPATRAPRSVVVTWAPGEHRFVQILAKARQDLTDLAVETVGTQQAEQPFPFRDVRLHYVVTGRGLKPALVHRAVRLSHERYCSAIATIRGVAEIGYTLEIHESREP